MFILFQQAKAPPCFPRRISFFTRRAPFFKTCPPPDDDVDVLPTMTMAMICSHIITTMVSFSTSTLFLVSATALLRQGQALSFGGDHHKPSVVDRRVALSTLSTALLMPGIASAADEKPKRSFRRYPSIRFISALGDPKSSSGTGSELWGLWRDVSHSQY